MEERRSAMVMWVLWLGYGLRDWGIVFRFQAGANDFSLHKTCWGLQPRQVAEGRVSRNIDTHLFSKNVHSSVTFCVMLPCNYGTLWKEAWHCHETFVPVVVPVERNYLIFFYFSLFLFLYFVYTLISVGNDWVHLPVGQTGSLDHLSCAQQQQISRSCRKVLLGKNGTSGLGWESCRAFWIGVWEGIFFLPKLRWGQICREWLEK